MPRKVDEAWNDDGFPDFEPVTFTDEMLDRWLAMLGPAQRPIDREQLRAELTEIGLSLRGGHRRGARSFTVRQATKALETLLAFPSIEGCLIGTLNGRAELEVHNQLLMMDLPIYAQGLDVVEGLAADRISEATLREAARRAIVQLNTPPNDRFGKPGKKLSRERDATLPWAVEELCKLWEHFTGRLVTSWNKEAGEYRSHLTSESGIWITEIVVYLTSARGRARTRLAVQEYVKKRKTS